MANEGFSEEERRAAAISLVPISAPDTPPHLVKEIADIWIKHRTGCAEINMAIDLQCSLTRAQNELAEANRKLAEREGK